MVLSERMVQHAMVLSERMVLHAMVLSERMELPDGARAENPGGDGGRPRGDRRVGGQVQRAGTAPARSMTFKGLCSTASTRTAAAWL
eukprot:1555009-Rhodomonas_salina.1